MTQQTMTDTPEAVRLADALEDIAATSSCMFEDEATEAAALLRRIPDLETARNVAIELAAQYAAERDQLRAELDARWQPIETAPKDGTNVLLINRALNQAAGLWMNSISGVGWYLRGGIGPDVFFNSHYGPTHWMPLPAAPTPPNADQKGQL